MFKLKVEPLALKDIQEAYDHYEELQNELGNQFLDVLDHHFLSLKINPFYQVRYDNVHCLPMNRFPYMIHFTIDEINRKVIVRAVLNTAKDPEEWKTRGF